MEIVNPAVKRERTPVKREKTRNFDNDIIEIIDTPTPSARNAKKRKRAAPEPDVIEISDSDSEQPTVKRRYKGKEKAHDTGELITIGRQLRVEALIPLDLLPTAWTVPAPECNVAYFLDMRSDTSEWTNKKGELLSMSGIIKAQVRCN